MRIEAVSKDKKHCAAVLLDNGERLLIDRDVASEYGLRPQDEISGEKLEEIKERSDYVRARERALWYLDRSDRTEREIRQKLIQAEFAESSVNAVIDRLKSLGLLDDRRYAANYFERLSRQNKSMREISAKLYEKGISRNITDELFSSCGTDEKEKLRALIDKHYRAKLCDRDGVQRVYAALVRRGFSFGQVREALSDYINETENLSEESV